MEAFSLVIFGITSNLAQVKLIPALYDMEEQGLIPERVKIIGCARGEMTTDEISNYFWETLQMDNRHHQHAIEKPVFEKLCARLEYVHGNLSEEEFYLRLKTKLEQIESETGTDNRIFYLATYPDLYRNIFDNLKNVELSKQTKGWVRLMIEKPIGSDLASASDLNKLLHEYFEENQIYRLDHYLGKETLQNILAFRFGNGIFEPLLNKEYIDHIQITASEDFGVGRRGAYYDKVGALRDVGQNHQLQMIAFATMDAPNEFTNVAVTAERGKILRNLIPDPESIVFGQYEGYTGELNVDPSSDTDTYYAFKTTIANERFEGVPIYVRAGKMLKESATEISIVFKQPVNRLFTHLDCGDEPNVLVYRLAPNEGIVFKILTKKPGKETALEPDFMQFCYRNTNQGHYLPDPYERLLLDAISGDQTFFNDDSEIEAEWKFIDPLVKRRTAPQLYPVGSWGPKAAEELIGRDGRSWLEPSMDFCKI